MDGSPFTGDVKTSAAPGGPICSPRSGAAAKASSRSTSPTRSALTQAQRRRTSSNGSSLRPTMPTWATSCPKAASIRPRCRRRRSPSSRTASSASSSATACRARPARRCSTSCSSMAQRPPADRAATFVKIVADAGPSNGLSQPFWVDTNDDGLADTIYAGDLKGNMWKFNVASTDQRPGAWLLAGPLRGERFGQRRAADHHRAGHVPSAGRRGRLRHGQVDFSRDFPDGTRNYRIFGIWDKPSYATALGTIPAGVVDLQQRSWTLDTSTGAIVQGSVTAIDWSTKKGCTWTYR